MSISKKAVLPLLAAALLAPASLSLAKEADISNDKPRRPVTVTSDSMEASANENRVVFKGNVVAVEDFTLCSDELQIMYDNNKEVSQIEAAGNVRIFQDQKTSTSSKAVYDRKERVIVLTGEPLVRQCSDTIKGDRITVYLDKDNALVESGGGGRVKAVIMPDKNCPEDKASERPVSEEARCKGTR
ncbi:MAG TPA: lipopolysaccharide transport periplasmic protein LptA [Thermodesulfobacteriota bacterium]